MSDEAVPPVPYGIDLQQIAAAEGFLQAPVYAYGEIVQVRPADGFCIAFERTVRNGRVEAGFVLTHPGDRQIISGQEMRVVSREAFQRYRQLPDGNYMRVGCLVRAFQNPLGVPVIATGAAGEEMTGGKDCMFAMKVPDGSREPLRQGGFIEPDQFEATCRPYEDVFGRQFGQRTAKERLATHLQTVRGLRWLAGRILPEWQQI